MLFLLYKVVLTCGSAEKIGRVQHIQTKAYGELLFYAVVYEILRGRLVQGRITPAGAGSTKIIGPSDLFFKWDSVK